MGNRRRGGSERRGAGRRVASIAILLSALLVGSASGVSAQGEVRSAGDPDEVRRPNVVIIVSDDHRWDVAGCNGNPYILTPGLDRLAREGVNFVNAFATSGLCTPSRASLLTGKYSHQAGAPRITWMNHTFHRQEESFFLRLQEAGYRTAHVGKWHLGRGHEPKRGYDSWAGFEWLGTFFDPEIWIDGEPKRFEGFTDDVLAELAAEHILEQADRDEPLALFVGLKSPHLDFLYPPRHEHAFDEISIPPPATYDEDLATSGKSCLAGTRIKIDEFYGGLPMFGDSWDRYVKSYYRSTLAIDDAVGRILGAIDEAGIGEDTLVLYTSDQGYNLGDHGLTEKYFAYEGTMRVPLLVRYPRSGSAGRQREEMVLNIDLAATVLELCGLDSTGEMAGRSWMPLLEAEPGSASPWREDFLFVQSSRGREIPGQIAVRTARHKLIHYPEFGRSELYDLAADPLETVNLATDREHASLLADMRARLARLVEETDWKPRIPLEVRGAWLLGPVPPEDLDEVRAALSPPVFTPEGTWIEAGGHSYPWEEVRVERGGYLPLGALESAPSDHRGFLAIPVRRLAPRDPSAELHYTPLRRTNVWVNGELTGSDFRADHPYPVINPPLDETENLVVLEMHPGRPGWIRVLLDAPAGSVELTR
jgi:arylsulfatase A-like enzyme